MNICIMLKSKTSLKIVTSVIILAGGIEYRIKKGIESKKIYFVIVDMLTEMVFNHDAIDKKLLKTARSDQPC